MTKFYIICILAYQAIVHGFDPRIIFAQAVVESSLRPWVSNGPCKGLLQVNTKIWGRELNIDESRIFDPGYNLDIGMDILRSYYQQTGSMDAALARYNAGTSYDGRPYVRKIRRVLNESSCGL